VTLFGARSSTLTSVTCVQSPFCGTVRAVTKPNQSDYIDWNEGRREREAYLPAPPKPTYATVPKPASKPTGQQHFLGIRTEVRVGSLLAGAGAIWAAYVATVDYNSLWQMQIMPPGPVEVCALGVLVWLHAKWRRSMKVN
jgi:hypothetical protein